MGRHAIHWAGTRWPDPRGSRAWRKLRDQVVLEEPICWLRYDGCTIRSTTADHVIAWCDRPDLGMTRTNLRGACHHCNSVRGKRQPQRKTKAKPDALSIFD